MEKIKNKGKLKEYAIWIMMRQRCYKKDSPKYYRYGLRGIYVCDRWKDSFENFFQDMGPKPPEHTLDRIDNNGPYSPENCRWATHTEQNNNKSTTKYITYQGETKSCSEWSVSLGGIRSLVSNRIRSGWSEEKAVSTPIHIKAIKIPKVKTKRLEGVRIKKKNLK